MRHMLLIGLLFGIFSAHASGDFVVDYSNTLVIDSSHESGRVNSAGNVTLEAGSRVGKLELTGVSTLLMNAGEIGTLDARGASKIVQTGGHIESLTITGGSTMQASDAIVGAITSTGGSNLSFLNADVGPFILSNGSIATLLNSTVELLDMRSGSSAIVRSGHLSEVKLGSGTTLRLEGHDTLILGQGLTPSGYTVKGTGLLHGTWATGAPFSINVSANAFGTILIPEPAVLAVPALFLILLRRTR